MNDAACSAQEIDHDKIAALHVFSQQQSDATLDALISRHGVKQILEDREKQAVEYIPIHYKDIYHHSIPVPNDDLDDEARGKFYYDRAPVMTAFLGRKAAGSDNDRKRFFLIEKEGALTQLPSDTRLKFALCTAEVPLCDLPKIVNNTVHFNERVAITMSYTELQKRLNLTLVKGLDEILEFKPSTSSVGYDRYAAIATVKDKDRPLKICKYRDVDYDTCNGFISYHLGAGSQIRPQSVIGKLSGIAREKAQSP